MEGGALSVRCGNGIEVSGAGLSFHLDPRSLSTKKVPTGTVCCTSHAHSDHIPSTFERKGPNRIVVIRVHQALHLRDQGKGDIDASIATGSRCTMPAM